MTFDIELFMNNNGFSGICYQDRSIETNDFRKVIPDFMERGADSRIGVYTSKFNNHVLITSAIIDDNGRKWSEELTVFCGKVKDENQFKQLLEMLYIK